MTSVLTPFPAYFNMISQVYTEQLYFMGQSDRNKREPKEETLPITVAHAVRFLSRDDVTDPSQTLSRNAFPAYR